MLLSSEDVKNPSEETDLDRYASGIGFSGTTAEKALVTIDGRWEWPSGDEDLDEERDAERDEEFECESWATQRFRKPPWNGAAPRDLDLKYAKEGLAGGVAGVRSPWLVGSISDVDSVVLVDDGRPDSRSGKVGV